MEKNKVKSIHDYGQSIWLDFIDRKIMDTGELQKLITEDGVRGVTSNPAIFEKAISSSSDYDADIRELSQEQENNEALFYSLAVRDIKRAADLFKPVFEEEVRGADGYISLEVSPHLARDTKGTIRQARQLWKAVDRENVMIKIPGTPEGIPAIRTCISEGININVTLLFSLDRYKEVAEAYIAGLEERVNANKPIAGIASVASFFLSRIDVLIDPQLKEKGLDQLQGEVAIASAKKAYQLYKEIFGSERFKKLEAKGARPQRLLWASTSSKNPAFSDTKYVEALIGPNTINTIPLETLEAFRDHGKLGNTLEQNLDKAEQVLAQLKQAGIDLDAVTHQLEVEGIEKFNKPYDHLLEAIGLQRKKALAAGNS
ncbi:transaldolase [Pontibacter liquoris]|uniref:transaldolase n=1 Tax=Pontibacter liquoris TaxID=2905677 RepID=UPI001FA6C5FE|nr:transaldolase [Pontibacter liquoris]